MNEISEDRFMQIELMENNDGCLEGISGHRIKVTVTGNAHVMSFPFGVSNEISNRKEGEVESSRLSLLHLFSANSSAVERALLFSI